MKSSRPRARASRGALVARKTRAMTAAPWTLLTRDVPAASMHRASCVHPALHTAMLAVHRQGYDGDGGVELWTWRDARWVRTHERLLSGAPRRARGLHRAALHRRARWRRARGPRGPRRGAARGGPRAPRGRAAPRAPRAAGVLVARLGVGGPRGRGRVDPRERQQRLDAPTPHRRHARRGERRALHRERRAGPVAPRDHRAHRHGRDLTHRAPGGRVVTRRRVLRGHRRHGLGPPSRGAHRPAHGDRRAHGPRRPGRRRVGARASRGVDPDVSQRRDARGGPGHPRHPRARRAGFRPRRRPHRRDPLRPRGGDGRHPRPGAAARLGTREHPAVQRDRTAVPRPRDAPGEPPRGRRVARAGTGGPRRRGLRERPHGERRVG